MPILQVYILTFNSTLVRVQLAPMEECTLERSPTLKTMFTIPFTSHSRNLKLGRFCHYFYVPRVPVGFDYKAAILSCNLRSSLTILHLKKMLQFSRKASK